MDGIHENPFNQGLLYVKLKEINKKTLPFLRGVFQRTILSYLFTLHVSKSFKRTKRIPKQGLFAFFEVQFKSERRL